MLIEYSPLLNDQKYYKRNKESERQCKGIKFKMKDPAKECRKLESKISGLTKNVKAI